MQDLKPNPIPRAPLLQPLQVRAGPRVTPHLARGKDRGQERRPLGQDLGEQGLDPGGMRPRHALHGAHHAAQDAEHAADQGGVGAGPRAQQGGHLVQQAGSHLGECQSVAQALGWMGFWGVRSCMRDTATPRTKKPAGCSEEGVHGAVQLEVWWPARSPHLHPFFPRPHQHHSAPPGSDPRQAHPQTWRCTGWCRPLRQGHSRNSQWRPSDSTGTSRPSPPGAQLLALALLMEAPLAHLRHTHAPLPATPPHRALAMASGPPR